ncbi:hypothetical protein SLEP1_g22576 [Rubroshorea leprosula]|uniref:Uncharacterized protein n=1 Tax=Rubroshorea leprosula TaxID=152421 RepID=A0AAV5JIG9_9ROSI|nr:hypothetical protein SLEP1_g22576 [Rubroshorea leprosula]
MNPLQDILTSNFNLESHKKEGYEEGYNHDLIAGKEEGWQVGLKYWIRSRRGAWFLQGLRPCVEVCHPGGTDLVLSPGAEGYRADGGVD